MMVWYTFILTTKNTLLVSWKRCTWCSSLLSNFVSNCQLSINMNKVQQTHHLSFQRWRTVSTSEQCLTSRLALLPSALYLFTSGPYMSMLLVDHWLTRQRFQIILLRNSSLRESSKQLTVRKHRKLAISPKCHRRTGGRTTAPTEVEPYHTPNMSCLSSLRATKDISGWLLQDGDARAD